MKRIVLFFVFSVLMLPSFTFCQDSNAISKSYNSKPFSPKFKLMSSSVLHLNDETIITKDNLPIQIVNKSSDSLFVFPDVHFTTQRDSSLQYKIQSLNTAPYLLLSNGRDVHMKFTDWDAKLLSIPIKIRPKLDDAPLQFVGEVSLGSYAGYQFGRSTISSQQTSTVAHTLAIFAAPSMVKVNPEQAATDMSNVNLGFSSGIAYIFNLNTFQIGFVGGIDFISGDISETWIYQGKPWFSFTIGFDFNDEENNPN